MKKYSYIIYILVGVASMVSCSRKNAPKDDAPIVDVATVKGLG